MTSELMRAQLLMQQSQYDLAEKELRLALGNEPENSAAHSLLALVKLEQGEEGEALQEAVAAVRIAPDSSDAHYYLAMVHHRSNRKDEALSAVREALRLDPDDVDCYGLLSSILATKEQWNDALEAADRGLSIDPENIECTNLRAVALLHLNRRAEAGLTIEEALRSDPEDPVTHANYGWTLLHQGEPERAMEHFREALRLDPTSDWARRGIVEALKARNPVYRVVLGYFLWMSRMSAKARWGVLIGAWVLSRIVAAIGRTTPELRPVALAVLVIYASFALLTWIARPLFNLTLRLNRFGRLALSREDIVASNWLGACILLALLTLIAGLALHESTLLIAAAGVALMTMPVAGVFSASSKKGRLFLAAYTGVLAGLGITSVWLSLQGDPNARSYGGFFLLGWVGFSWIGNIVYSRE